MIEVFIPHKLHTLNEYIQIERGNRYAAAKKKKTFTELCSLYFTEDIPTPCEVECIWNFKNFNSDSDNIAFGCKFFL